MKTINCASAFGGLKNLNRHAILSLIRFTPGGISRAEIARQMQLSRSAVTEIVNEFIDAGVVHETESGPTSSGRRPILLGVAPQRGYVIGIDMGATHLAMVIADAAARVIAEIETPFDVNQGPEICLKGVDEQVRVLARQAGLRLEDILTVGVGVPGPIAGDGGAVIEPPIMPGWHDYPIRDHLQRCWERPVSLNNDAELGALGEWAYGAGRSESDLIYIKVGSGVGAGLILNDCIYRGATGTAGEIGHITIDEHGPECRCGNRGCLEAAAGGRAIARQAQAAVKRGQGTQLSAIKPVDKITASDVAAAARRGDLVSQKIVAEAGYRLGTAIAGLVNVLNPGMVVVGGGVAQTGDLLLEPIRQAVRGRTLKAAGQSVRITAALLGRRSSCMGAVVQALTVAMRDLTEKIAEEG